jgi:hypothetical protein
MNRLREFYDANKGRAREVAGNLHDYAKENRVLSGAANASGVPHGQTIGTVLNALGYGRKKRAPRKTATKKRAPAKRMTKAGKGFFDFVGKAVQAPLAGIAGLSGGLHQAIGAFGKRKPGRPRK